MSVSCFPARGATTLPSPASPFGEKVAGGLTAEIVTAYYAAYSEWARAVTAVASDDEAGSVMSEVSAESSASGDRARMRAEEAFYNAVSADREQRRPAFRESCFARFDNAGAYQQASSDALAPSSIAGRRVDVNSRGDHFANSFMEPGRLGPSGAAIPIAFCTGEDTVVLNRDSASLRSAEVMDEGACAEAPRRRSSGSPEAIAASNGPGVGFVRVASSAGSDSGSQVSGARMGSCAADGKYVVVNPSADNFRCVEPGSDVSYSLPTGGLLVPGEGTCYRAMFVSARERLGVARLGPWPTFGSLLELPSDWFRDDFKLLRVSRVASDRYHVSPYGIVKLLDCLASVVQASDRIFAPGTLGARADMRLQVSDAMLRRAPLLSDLLGGNLEDGEEVHDAVWAYSGGVSVTGFVVPVPFPEGKFRRVRFKHPGGPHEVSVRFGLGLQYHESSGDGGGWSGPGWWIVPPAGVLMDVASATCGLTQLWGEAATVLGVVLV